MKKVQVEYPSHEIVSWDTLDFVYEELVKRFGEKLTYTADEYIEANQKAGVVE